MQNEKRQLETNLVVEQRIQNRETDKESIASQSDDEQDEDDVGSAVSNEDGSEDVFFECNTDLSRLSSKPLLPDETSTSGTGQYSQGTTADHQKFFFFVRERYIPTFCCKVSAVLSNIFRISSMRLSKCSVVNIPGSDGVCLPVLLGCSQ